MTQTIVYELFEIFVMCSGILGAEKEIAAKISKMMPKVNTLTRGSRGQLLEWEEEYEQWDAHHIENDREEYSVCYKNITEPYSADYDVEIVCRYVGRKVRLI